MREPLSNAVSVGAVFGLATLLAVAAITTDADARGRRHRPPARGRRRKLRALLFLDRGGRQFRRGDAGDQCRQSAPSGLADQDHDALPAVRAAGGGQDQDRRPKCRFRPMPPPRRHPSSGSKPGQSIEVETAIRAIVTKSANDVAVIVAEALGGSEARIRQADDRQGACARHEAHDLSKRVRAARRSADHHRTRPGHSRPRHPRSISEILPLIFRPELSRFTAR